MKYKFCNFRKLYDVTFATKGASNPSHGYATGYNHATSRL